MSLNYEIRTKEFGRWTAWRPWLSHRGRVTGAADEFFAGNWSGRISFKRPGVRKFQLRVKK